MILALDVFILAVASVCGYVFAAPVLQLRNGLDIWNPAILSPTQNTVWKVDTLQMVTWSTSDAPESVSDAGYVALKGANDVFVFLASNFSLMDGRVQVSVPSVSPGFGYSIILFGDSSNVSPTFTISQ